MRGDAQCCYRRCVKNIARQVELFLGWVVMITQEIVRLYNINVMDLCCLQDFASALGAGNVGARAHLAPPAKRAAHPNLRPDSNDQRDAHVKQPVRTQAKTVWAADIQQATRTQNKTQ